MIEATSSQGYALEVVQDSNFKGKSVITTLAVLGGDLIAQISGHREMGAPNRFTVQVSVSRHIDGLWQLTYMNHSCAPNVFLDTTELSVFALRDIAVGEELSFFYPSTEWRMAEPFECLCGTPECIGKIAGAEVLSAETLARYKVNQHILALHRGSAHTVGVQDALTTTPD